MLTPPFYVISDTHFFHDNIVQFCGRNEQLDKLLQRNPSHQLAGKRIDHNEYMVDRWNATVGPDDIILHLGDVTMYRGRDRYRREIMPRLNGEKYVLRGNHDHENLEELGFTVLEPFTMPYKGLEVNFSHYPEDPGVLHPEGKIVHVHGHIHCNGYPVKPGPNGWRYGTTENSPMQINVSVEVIDYTPQPIEALLEPYLTT